MPRKKLTKRFKPKSKKSKKKLKLPNTMVQKRLNARKKYRSWG